MDREITRLGRSYEIREQLLSQGTQRVFYEEDTNTLYLETRIGCWKIFERHDGLYALKHMNNYMPGMEKSEIVSANYHVQKDVVATESLKDLYYYVINHDKAMNTIATQGIKALPTRTKKQKKYARAAEKRVRNKGIREVNDLFKLLESQNSEYRQLSCC